MTRKCKTRYGQNMNKHRKILSLITLIRESHSAITDIYTKGSCLNFFCILHSIYPEAIAWFNINHIISEIDGKFYDITGEVKCTSDYMKYTEWYNKRRTSRSFKRMYTNELKINGYEKEE